MHRRALLVHKNHQRRRRLFSLAGLLLFAGASLLVFSHKAQAVEVSPVLATTSTSRPVSFTQESQAEKSQEQRSATISFSEEPYYLSWGETVAGKLLDEGLPLRLAFNVVDKLSLSEVDVSRWRTNDPIGLLRTDSGQLMGLKFETPANNLQISWVNQNIELTNDYRSLYPRQVAQTVVIENSLYADGETAGISAGVLMELLGIYSFDVDLQRDLQPGNRFELLYTIWEDARGRKISDGDILYASLENSDANLYSYFLFEDLQGQENYYEPNGQSLRKALMKTPINGAYISSSYGYRNNPTRRGYTDYHTGIDFAAPRGTPIYAAGNGKIIVRGWSRKGYGNYVMIEHANGYRTLYAHMSAFRRGQGAGTRVKQGEVIGYVGSSGNSTGNHLHYEVYYNYRTINPLHLQSPPERNLTGREKELLRQSIQAQMSSVGSALPLATSLLVKSF